MFSIADTWFDCIRIEESVGNKERIGMSMSEPLLMFLRLRGSGIGSGRSTGGDFLY